MMKGRVLYSGLSGLLLFPLLVTIFVLLVSGCQDSDAKILTGSTNLNAYTVLQGVVSGESLRHSESRIISLSSDSTTTGTTEVAEQNSSTAEDGMEVGLATENGMILQRKYFNTRNEDGGLRYNFEGDFGTSPLRLRFYDEQGLFEVAIGTPGANAVLDLPPIDYKKAALATRYIEQSSAYRELREKSPLEFRNYMDSVVQNLVTPMGSDLELHLANIERVGVNEAGELQIFTTDYFPDSYKAPQQTRAWEERLSQMIGNGGSLSSQPALTSVASQPSSTTVSDIPSEVPVTTGPTRPLPRVLINWLSSVYVSDYLNDEETLLYNVNSNWVNENYRSASGRLYLRFNFKNGFPAEYATDFIEKGWLQISPFSVSGNTASALSSYGNMENCRQNISIKSLPVLESGNSMSVSLDMAEILPECYQDLLFTLEGNFTPLRPDEIPLVRARFILKGA